MYYLLLPLRMQEESLADVLRVSKKGIQQIENPHESCNGSLYNAGCSLTLSFLVKRRQAGVEQPHLASMYHVPLRLRAKASKVVAWLGQAMRRLFLACFLLFELEGLSAGKGGLREARSASSLPVIHFPRSAQWSWALQLLDDLHANGFEQLGWIDRKALAAASFLKRVVLSFVVCA